MRAALLIDDQRSTAKASRPEAKGWALEKLNRSFDVEPWTFAFDRPPMTGWKAGPT
jgi:hypothetical protein